MSKDIRVLIVDDHMVVRTGLAQVLNDAEGVHVVAEAASGEEAVYLAQQHRPDIVIVDLKMAGMGGVEATRLMVQANNAGAVIGLTTFSDAEHIQAMQNAGAKGYLLKEALSDDIVAAIHRVHSGHSVFPMPDEQSAPPPNVEQAEAQPSLGDQQKRVLALMIKGLTNPEIAAHLGLSRATIGYHVSAILRKLQVSNRSEAVAQAVRHELVSESDI